MIKIKPLLPVLKEKKRYLLYEIDGKNKISNDEIESGVRDFIGDLGMARAGFRFVKNKNNKGIIQVNHKYVDEVKTGLMLIKKINRNQVRFRTVKVSGVINKLMRDSHFRG